MFYWKLTGLFFDIIHGVSKRVPPVCESRCIHARHNCTFANTVHFVGDIAKSDVRYWLVAGGNLIFIYRRTCLSSWVFAKRLNSNNRAITRTSIFSETRCFPTPHSEGVDKANHRISSRIVLDCENLYGWIPSAIQNRRTNPSRMPHPSLL